MKNRIFSLRELEYHIKQDIVFETIIGLKQVPDYSTFSLRAKALEKHIYYGIYAMFIERINPETRICAIDATYDSTSWFEIVNKLELNLLTNINMRKSKDIASFNDMRYKNALFLQSPVGARLYKSRLKIE
ncbi:transposase [Clostridium senegalense]|uniref:transposase n=1 Tax=Clostridium senegalense TaxID=1465809 RepID=UPI00325BA899